MSLTLAEARARAAVVSAVSYDIEIDLTGSVDTFASRVSVAFEAAVTETFLELHLGQDVHVTVNGEHVAPAYDGHRVSLTGLRPHNEVTVSARLPYVTDGDGMHAFTDPADGERYVSAYVGIDITQRVFACFDQVDLKAPLTVRVVADPAWTVLANALPAGSAAERASGTWAFAPTPLLPVDLFVLCAGPWHSSTWEHRGVPMGLHTRRSLASELDRDADELRRITEACFDHFTAMFDEPFPFDSYDQVFVPGLNWGAMETPGCVTFRDEMLPRGRISDTERAERAMVMAHEMSHMWFGDLVTMRWWEDTWLNESFAEYMGFRVAEDAAGFVGAQVGFESHDKPRAYVADRRRSTHPVAPRAEDVPDVDSAFANFDAISYAKGGAVLRQLVTWMGDEDFLLGVNAHLTRHRFANASLADLVTALHEASPRDLHAWSEVWLRRTGHDTIRVERDGDVPVLVRDGVRPHRFTVTAYDAGLAEVGSRLVDLDDDPVRLDDWAGRAVVPNAQGETFARLVLDPATWAAVARGLSRVQDDVVRALLWGTSFDLVHTRALAVPDFIALLATHLPRETHPVLVDAAVHQAVHRVVPLRASVDGAARVHDAVAGACLAGLGASTDEQRVLALTRGLARTSRDTDLLTGWLGEGRTGQGLALDPTTRWHAVVRLAELGAMDAAEIEAERHRDGTSDGDLKAATALAARPTAAAKDAAWAEMTTDHDISNRRFAALADGLWSSEHPALVRDHVTAYLESGPALAARGQAFATVVGHGFPRHRLDADQLDGLRQALAGHVPTVLRRAWEDDLDDRE